MVQLIFGSFLLSIIHAAIPNHWVPIVLISKTESWTKNETVIATTLTGLSHILSTIILGIIIGMIGYKLSSSYEIVTNIIAPLILISMGLLYVSLDMKHSHQGNIPRSKDLAKKSKTAIIITLSVAMFFSPCLEIETYYFMAGTLGWKGIAAVSLVYLTVTISGMVILVLLGCKSIERFNWHFMEHHEKEVTGVILILFGILSFFIKI